MIKAWHNFLIFLIVLGLSIFISVSILGIWHSFGMETNQDGKMSGCIFTGETTICKMSVIEHISLWQNIFTTIPQEITLLAILLVLAIAVWFAFPHSQHFLDTKTVSAGRLYLTRHIELPLFDPLRRAFAKGILHPKIYEFANI